MVGRSPGVEDKKLLLLLFNVIAFSTGAKYFMFLEQSQDSGN